MSITKVGPKHQVTIPKDVFERLDLAVGDYLEVRIQGPAIGMVPAKLIPRDQAWFHTPEWQAKEQEADESIRRKDVSGPFTSAEELIRRLEKGRRRKQRPS
jgi:antitoxin MazE